jgi:hypothetical protein
MYRRGTFYIHSVLLEGKHHAKTNLREKKERSVGEGEGFINPGRGAQITR